VLTRDKEISAEHVREVLAITGPLPGGRLGGAADVREAVSRWARDHLAVGGNAATVDELHERLLAVVEPVLLAETLAALDGNQIRTAAILGMNRNTLRKKLNQYDIDPAMPLRIR
jgi:two-component system nitrogen regulation response regulator GlnG